MILHSHLALVHTDTNILYIVAQHLSIQKITTSPTYNVTQENRVSTRLTNIEIRSLVSKCEEQKPNEILSILYKNSEGTCLVYSTTTCRSPTRIGTTSAVMPFLMTHSASLPRLNLPQVLIFPSASPFSPYPINFIPYS